MIFWLLFGFVYVAWWALVFFLRCVIGLIVLFALLIASIIATLFIRLERRSKS